MKHITNNKPLSIAVLLAHLFFATIFMLQAQELLPSAGTNPVGAIPGEIDVSPMGAATYTIPIEVVPGTQGMQPNLSIVYNSMSGMGLLGMKWNLTGLSAITRCGQTPYYDDGNIAAINWDGKRFALDGNRLILLNNGLSSWLNKAEWATEIEDFTRIISHSSARIGSPPTSFTAYTDNGTIINYGNTSDSKQVLGANIILSWYINKITDANGNYMTFHYGSSNGEIWINEIKYTYNPNSTFTQYATVKFNYDTIHANMGKNTCFVGGYGVPQTKLLKNITVYYGNDIVRKYQFNYYEISMSFKIKTHQAK